MQKLVIFLLVLFFVGCQSNPPQSSEAEPDHPTSETEITPQSNTDTAEEPVETETPAPQPEPQTPDMELVVAGPEEVVFDWTNDRCEDEHIPDIAARAFRDAEGMVQLWIGHYVNYRMIGPDLNHMEPDCTLLMQSDYDPDPSNFNDSEWLAAPYTEDGNKIYAIVHNEYRGDTHNAARPGQCPSGERLTCLDTSVTMVISTDGGDSYLDILEPPNHMVATLPYTFNDQGVPSGLRQPSNIIRGQDGYFYVYTNISDYPANPGDFPPQWICAMRTDDLSDPSSWRFWDGEGFSGKFVNPYIETVEPDTPKCAPLEKENLSGSLNESVTYNTALGRYIMIGYSHHPTAADPTWGYYYSLSDDLVHWTQRELLLQLPGENAVEDSATDTFYAYPSLIDPDSPSMNFETSDENAYLYLTRFNNGVTLDRDLIRFPVELAPVTYEIPQWEFETDGDVEGWIAENHIESFDVMTGVLSMLSSGDDPYLVSAPVEFPASDYGRLRLTMKISAGETTIGQVFFTTDNDPFWDEAKSLVFDVISDGEFHTYDLDMSTVSGWRGLVLNLRLDPVGSAGRTIEVDRIAVGP